MTDLYEGVDKTVRLALLAAFVACPLSPELAPGELRALVLEEGVTGALYDEALERGSRWREAQRGAGIKIEAIDLVALRMRGLFPHQLRYSAADEVCRAFRWLNEKMGAKAPKTFEMLCSQAAVSIPDVGAGLGLLLIYQLAKRVEGGFTCTTEDMRGYADEDRKDASGLEARLEAMTERVRAILTARTTRTPGEDVAGDGLHQAGGAKHPNLADEAFLTATQQEALDLVASMLLGEQLALPMGLEVRRRMSKGSREAKTNVLRQLVPDCLTLQGRGREDAYSLAPRGALRCTQATRFLQLASALRPFFVAEYLAKKDRVTWESIKGSVLVDGRALVDSERELVGYVAFCLGVWGGSGEWWPRPLAPQLEDLLDDELDVRTLFMRVHDELRRQREAMRQLESGIASPPLASAPASAAEKARRLDPYEVRRRAKEIFEEHFRACDRDLNVIPEDDGDRAALHELARKGLAQETNGGGAFRIGPRGVEVCMDEAELETLLGLDESEQSKDAASVNVPDPGKVFIIHGRNLSARSAVEQFVRCLGLDPLDFDKVSSDLGGSPFIGEVVRKGLELAHATIALFTPDEYSSLIPSLRRRGDKPEEALRWQSRPNVIFEAGMAFGMNPKRTVLVTFGDDVSLFSDVAGVHTVRLDNSTENRKKLRRRLIGMKCAVNENDDAWTDPARSGDFEACVSNQPAFAPVDGFSKVPHQAEAPAPARSSLSSGAAQYMQRLGKLYVEQGFPNHKVWYFDAGQETAVHNELMHGRGLIKLMGTRGSPYVLTDSGHAWIMSHLSPA